jgi:hypothetical protein
MHNTSMKIIITILIIILSQKAIAQNVGIGTTAPQSKLHVIGKIQVDSLKITAGAGPAKFLLSDATGNATWKNGVELSPFIRNGLSIDAIGLKMGGSLTETTAINLNNQTLHLSTIDTTKTFTQFAVNNVQSVFNTTSGFAWQSFTVLKTGTLDSVNLFVAPVVTSHTITIYKGEGIAGAIVASVSVNNNSTTSTWLKFPFTNIALNRDSVYTISLANGEGWYLDFGDLYPFGKSNQAVGIDYGFRVNGKWNAQRGGLAIQSNGNVDINTSAKIYENNTIEFGKYIFKEQHAGKIGYQTFSDGLDIVGAGTTNTNRKIKFFAEAGSSFTGKITSTKNIETTDSVITSKLKITNGAANGNVLVSDAGGNAIWALPSSLSLPSSGWLVNAANIYNSNIGNVGVGINNPTAKFHVSGNARFDGKLNLSDSLVANNGFKLNGNAQIANNNFLELGNGITKQTDAGKIGYQLSSPDALDVYGAGTTNANRKIKFFAEAGTLFTGKIITSQNIETADSIIASKLKITNGAANGNVLVSDINGNAIWTLPSSLPTNWTTNGINIYSANTGNVGVGNIAPSSKFHVSGNTRIDGKLNLSDSLFAGNGFKLNANQQITSNNFLEMGNGIVKQTDAGKIGYQLFSDGLDIMGAGTTTTNRKIKFFAEAGASFTGKVNIADSLNVNNGLNLAADLQITGNNFLEFGKGLAKESNAGKIGYQTFTVNTLDIIGAGTSVANRKIKFWNEGGAEFTGNVGIGATNPVGSLDVSSTNNTALYVRGANSQIRIIENDSANKQWKIEINNNNFSVTEDGVASPLLLKAGSNANTIVTSNDTVTIKKLQVGNGTAIAKIQNGQTVLGIGTAGVNNFTITFPIAFSGIPKVTATLETTNVNDVFTMSVKQISATSFVVQVYRIDVIGGNWGQSLKVNWSAWE